MCAKWTEIIGNTTNQNVVFNIPAWLSRGTLDAIGQGTSPLPRDKNATLNFHQLHSMFSWELFKTMNTPWQGSITI